MNRFYQIGVSLLLIFVLVACVTKKKKGDAPWLKRNYHNLTTKYNFYYNANVLLQDGIAKLNGVHKDNYNQILEMYPYSAVSDTALVATEMNAAITKMTTAAAIHKWGDWVDDCALLMGKAQYLKRDFENAEETFLFLTEEYNPTKPKTAKQRKAAVEDKKKETKKKNNDKKKAQEKKKKETAKKKAAAKKEQSKSKGKKPQAKSKVVTAEIPETTNKKEVAKEDEQTPKTLDELDFKAKDITGSKPKSYFPKRRPAYQEGLAWLARTYTERQKYAEAEDVLKKLLASRSMFRDVRRMATQFYAYNLLKQKEYARAVKPLERAIKLTKSKKEKARFYFILGQIQEKLERDADALQAYEKVLAYKSIPYDMEFSARMNVALFAYTKGQGSADEANKSLLKMAKEAKNKDYYDQIFFAMAQICLKTNDRKCAIENLQKSLAFSKANPAQKGESYLLMAQLYFQDENFLRAKNYYDSTITVLPKSDERYDEAKRLAFGLTDIAKNLKIIQMQDSLLRIAAMTPEQQRAFCLKLKQKEIEAIEKAEAAAAAAAAGKLSDTDFNIQYPPGVTPSTFFAYNFKGIQQGKRNFEQKWGRDRKLEDDWRRKNKKTASEEGTLSGDPSLNEEKAKRDKSKLTDEEFRKMMANVPQQPMQIEAVNGEVANAILGLGKGYRETLQRNDKAIATLESLLVRYPETKNELEAWYNLYNAYTDLGNTSKAKEYYTKIVGKYPNTTYARILTDPDFMKKTKKEGQELDDYYKLTYENFQKGQFKVAYDRSIAVDTIFKGKKNTYKPKFALLSAMCVGSLSGRDKYIAAIKEVIANFPETPEQKRAKEILRFLDGGATDYSEVTGGGTIDSGPYKREDDAIHYVIAVLTDKNARVEEAKAKIADFNRDNYKSSNLKISNVFFGETSETPMMVVRKFDDKKLAMKYHTHVEKVRDAFMPEGTNFELFVITQLNYKELLKDKTIDKYREFFKIVYKEE